MPQKPADGSKCRRRIGRRLSWLALAALASMAFLAITNHLCQDIAVVPFMWVIPLSLYLLSFIICFDNERWYLRKTFGVLAILMIYVADGDPQLRRGQRRHGVSAESRRDDVFAADVRRRRRSPGYAKKTFTEKVSATQLHGKTIGFGWFKANLPITFSKMNDRIFEGMGWVVEKIDGVLQLVVRRPHAGRAGERRARLRSLDKNKDGKLTVDEVPSPLSTTLVSWDTNSDGEVTEDGIQHKAGKREPQIQLGVRRRHVRLSRSTCSSPRRRICWPCS